jgi:hypothetical protein
MARKLDDANRRAAKVNPGNAGVRTGNPQLEAHEGEKAGDSPRQRAPRRLTGRRDRPMPAAAIDKPGGGPLNGAGPWTGRRGMG